jgi:hypothetical protein
MQLSRFRLANSFNAKNVRFERLTRGDKIVGKSNG